MVEHSRLTLWEMAGWTAIDSLDGNWLDAALAPGGDLVAAVDFAGTLHIAKVSAGLGSHRPLAAPGPVSAVALGARRIVVALTSDATVRSGVLPDL